LRFQRVLTYVLILSMALPLPAQFGPPKPPPLVASSSWGPTFFPFTLVLIPLLIAWAVDYCSRPTDIAPERRRGVDPVLIAMLFLIGTSFVSVIANHADFRAASMWVSLFGLFAFARYRMPRIVGRSQVAVALAWIMVGLAFICAAQFATGRPVGAVATFFQHQVRSAQVYNGKGGGGLLKRAQGTFFSTDVFAMFLLYVVLFFIGVTRTVKTRFVITMMLVSVVLIGVTFSRGVWTATLLTVTSMMVVFVRRKQLKLSRLLGLASVLVAVVALAFVLAASTVFARLSSQQVQTAATTRDTATKVAECIGWNRPWLGVGYDAMVPRENIFNCNPNGNLIRAHNIYVQDFAEQGIFVLVSYLAVGFMMLFEALRRRRVDDPGSRAMRTAVAFSILAWLVFMTVYATANDFNVMPVWILLGGYGLTLLDTSRRVIEPLGGLAPIDFGLPPRREPAPV
jgi:O-antigen ligase